MFPGVSGFYRLQLGSVNMIIDIPNSIFTKATLVCLRAWENMIV